MNDLNGWVTQTRKDAMHGKSPCYVCHSYGAQVLKQKSEKFHIKWTKLCNTCVWGEKDKKKKRQEIEKKRWRGNICRVLCGAVTASVSLNL